MPKQKLLDPLTCKWVETQPEDMKVGDSFVLYGLEVCVVTKACEKDRAAYLEYDHKGVVHVGLAPGHKGDGVSKLVEKK